MRISDMLSYLSKLNIIKKTTPLKVNLIKKVGNKRVCLKGSLTIEAALAFPLIIFSMAILMMPFGVMNEERELIAKLDEYTQDAVSLVADSDEGENTVIKEFSDFVVDEDDMIVFEDSIIQKMPFDVLSLSDLGQSAVSSRRAWVGRKSSGEEGSEHAEEVEWVWIVENSEVYHIRETCSHIFKDFSVTTVEEARAQGIEACERCAAGAVSGVAYILPGMHHYHTSISCSSMNWNAKRVKKSDVPDRRPCRHCGG